MKYMSSLPSGTVTFLFTDIEGSTQLWEKHPQAMKSALAEHDSILKEAIESNHGHIIKSTGDGVHAVFTKAMDAINTAIRAQRILQSLIPLDVLGSTTAAQLKVRMGLHTGEAELRDGDYYGQTLNRAARIMSAGQGGQILISDVAAQVAREHLPAGVSLLELGEHHLKGLMHPERIFQLTAPELQKDFPPLHSVPTATNNLPTQLTSFIGRERERREAQGKLASTKLLTLIGPGGTGKTRLSIQIASEQLVNFKDGVWLVELAPISDPAFIASTIASVFEVREVQNIPLINLVIDYLRGRETLVVLDNCEHLVEASAQIANQFLHECPDIKIIASSREALGVDGETVFRVPSLKDDEATRLFIERATKAEPRFHVTDENASFVAQICSRLDGIPLAIELAAARVKLFSPKQIAERLDDRFKLLTGGSRTALPRQQTLRALIDWSYTSLNESEQRALRRLSVFSGGWTFEGAESVLGESEAMESLASLVNKSLVNVEEQESKSRYRFLETIRQYAMEKLLESGEAVAARDRHLDYVLRIAVQTEERMFGSETQEWLDQMEVEHDNLRTAFEWASSNHPALALKLAYAIGGFWTVRDHISEARSWCQLVLDKTKSLSDVNAERARVYSVLGWMSVTSGEHKSGRAAAEQAISLGKQTNDLSTVARGYGILALTSIFLGDYPTAQHAAMEGESLAREHKINSELAFILSVRAQMDYLSRKDLAQAKANLEEAAKLAREEGFRWASSFLAIGMAHTAAILGDLEVARAGFKESGEIARKMGNKRIVYSSQSELAHVLREHGDLDEPLDIYRDLLPKWKDLGHRAAVAHELECIAYILSRKEEPERAASLLGTAEEIRRVIDTPRTRAEEVEYGKEVAMLREMLGETSLEKKWGEGRAMTMEQAIQLAIGTP
jgi:predicted ATPase/class 3 adenylate cyclase